MSSELTGYWQSWNYPNDETLPITSVPPQCTNIIIAFIASDEEGNLYFAGPNIPTRHEVDFLRRRGHNVLLSMGGSDDTVVLDTDEKVSRFSDELYQLINELNVNGIDIDIEFGMPATLSPYQPGVAALGLINMLDNVLGLLPPDFLLTMAPQTLNLVGGITRYGGEWGNYLPLILHFGDRITGIHMQYYNTGAMIGIDGQVYEPETVEFVVAMTEAIIQGFPIADTGAFYPGFPSHKVSIGLPATPQAAVNGYLNALQIEEAVTMLVTGYRGASQSYAVPYPNIGGLMTWSLQWDSLNCFNFIRNGYYILQMNL